MLVKNLKAREGFGLPFFFGYDRPYDGGCRDAVARPTGDGLPFD